MKRLIVSMSAGLLLLFFGLSAVAATMHEDLVAEAKQGNVTNVNLLLSIGANVNSQDGDKTALFWAATNGHAEVARILLAKGAKVDVPDDFGQTALMMAVTACPPDIVRTMISKGARLDVKSDARGWSAIFYATYFGRADNVKVLISKGANVNLKDIDGKTALYYAADEKGRKETAQGRREIVKLLKNAGGK